MTLSIFISWGFAPFVISQPVHMQWKHVRSINASQRNESENKERKLSYQSNMAKHKYSHYCDAFAYACLINAYLICMKSLADKNSCRRKMKAALCLSPAQRPLPCTSAHAHRRASERYLWGKQARHVCFYLLVCLSQIYILYQSLNSCPKLAVVMATEQAFQHLLPALFPKQPWNQHLHFWFCFKRRGLISLTTSLDCGIKPLRMMQTVLQSSVYTLRWFKLSL